MSRSKGGILEEATVAMSAENARNVMALFMPGLAKKQKWSEADFVTLSAIFGLRSVQLETFARLGVRYPVWRDYLVRLRRTFNVAKQWLGRETIHFFTAANAQLRERPIDFLRHEDSLRPMLEEIVRECGTTMELVEMHLAS